MTLSPVTQSAIRAAMADAPHGTRTAMARRLATTYGVDVSTIYRAAERDGARRPRAVRRPEYREWVRVAVAWAHRAPKPVPLDLAIQAGVEAGALPPEAADMPIATAHRVARELCLTPTRQRTHRFHADYPMQAIQVDGSSSEHLVVDADLGGGDYRLRLHRRPLPGNGYKNKPLGPDRLRVLVYGLWDICTGYTRGHYMVARGESALDAMDALCWMLAETGDPHRPLHGVPGDLWADQGPLFKSGPAADLLHRLDVTLVTGAPYKKERMGGVERAWRTLWSRFERSLFLRGACAETITLFELNARLSAFEAKENARRVSRTPVGGRRDVSRAAAWVALTRARPADRPLRRLPDNPIETMAREAGRRIDRNGIVRWGGVEYECEDWHDRWVIARRSMDGAGDLIVEDAQSGERRTAVRYAARPYGTIRKTPATPLQQLLAVSSDEARGAEVYGPAPPSNVVPLPAKASAAAALVNPLDTTVRCRSLDEAMRVFTEHYPYLLSPENRALVVKRVEECGLERAAVIGLAQSLTALAANA